MSVRSSWHSVKESRLGPHESLPLPLVPGPLLPPPSSSPLNSSLYFRDFDGMGRRLLTRCTRVWRLPMSLQLNRKGQRPPRQSEAASVGFLLVTVKTLGVTVPAKPCGESAGNPRYGAGDASELLSNVRVASPVPRKVNTRTLEQVVQRCCPSLREL